MHNFLMYYNLILLFLIFRIKIIIDIKPLLKLYLIIFYELYLIYFIQTKFLLILIVINLNIDIFKFSL